MLTYSEPPGYRRTAAIKRPKLDEYTDQIGHWLSEDKGRPRKQRHVDRVVIGCAAEVIAEHVRSYEKDDITFNLRHYLRLIERKNETLSAIGPRTMVACL